MAGKRAGSVISAILQNPETLKDAFESANNAAGSALKENEKYLDSIQGRIDLFNNAVQTMWSNALNDDAVKFFVNLGTSLIKIVDNLGLIKTLFISIGAYILKKNFGSTLFGGQNNDAMKKAMQNLANAQKTLKEYTGDNAKQLYKYRDSVNRAQKAVDQLKQKQISAEKSGIKMWKNIKTGAKAALKSIKQFIQSMLIMTAVSAVFEVVGKGFEWFISLFTENSNSVEKANEEFEKFKTQLSDCESELKSLESELKSNQDAIDELMSQGALTYVEQEELERLKSVTSELENQIGLRKTLKESLQKSTNSSSVTTAKMYLANTSFGSEKSKTERQEEAQEQGEEIGKYAGLGIGATIAAVVALGAAGLFSGGLAWAAIPGVLAASATSIGIAGGAGYIIGQGVGGAFGSAMAGSKYDQEQNVQDAIKNMQEQRQALVDTQNQALVDKKTEAYNDATEALGNYDKQMATHISQMSEYYNSIDWATATTEEKEYARYLGDLLDTYNITMGAAGSKSSAINRIFGAEATDGLKKVKKAWEENTDSTKDFSTVLEETLSIEEYDTFISRLHNMGLYVVDLENYFKEVKAAEEDALPDDLTSVADDVNKVTDALETLKSAFDEINEKGYLTVKTFESLKEKFADNSDALAKYANVVLSGVSSTKEMIEATEELAKAYIDGKILNGEEVTGLERIEYIVQLKELGVTNAEEYVDDKIRENAYKAIKNSATYNYDEVKSAWLGEDSTRTDEDYETALADGTIDAWAKAHNYFKEISKEEAQEIADRYGIEIDNIDDVIDKLEELANAESELKQAQDAKGEYDDWVENYKKKEEELNALKKELNDFNPDDWTKEQRTLPGGAQEDTGYYTNGDKRLTTEEYEELKSKQEKLKQLQADFEKLKQEGQNKSTNGVVWVNENGELSDVVSKEFADAYNAAKEGKEDLEKEIETELTADVKLDIELQNKSNLVDDIQNVYDTLYSATKEYAKNGYINVDTLQSLLDLEPKYLSMLYDENGQLQFNKGTILEVAKARVTDLGIKAASNVIDKASAALKDNEIDTLKELTSATYDQADASWSLVEANLAVLKSDIERRNNDANDKMYGKLGGIYEGIESQVLAIQKLTNNAVANIGKSISSADDNDASDAFQNAMKYWENRISANRAEYDQIQNEIDLLEKQGKIAGEEYYQEQIKLENERKSLLEQQKAEAEKYLKVFKEGSDEFWEVASQLNNIQGDLDDVTSSIQDLQDAIDQVHWTIFDEAHERLSDLTGQLSAIRELLSIDEDSFFDDMGNWTEQGVAALGTYLQELNIVQSALDDVNKELSTISLSDFDSEQEYYDRVSELKKQQQDYAKSIADSKKSIVDMYEQQISAIEEYTQKAVENYKELIDLKKKELDAERDLYEFRKSTEEKTKNITELERKIAGLSGSTAASDIAQRRKLEAELRDQQSELADSYYDHAKDAQSNALDDEADAFEKSQEDYIKSLRETLDEAKLNMDAFLQGVTASVMLNAGVVEEQYKTTGLSIDESLVTPWTNAAIKMQEYADVALPMMNEWTSEKGFFGQFSSTASSQLVGPWAAGAGAAEQFRLDSSKIMSQIVSNIQQNVITAQGQLKGLYDDIIKTQKKAAEGAEFTVTTTYRQVDAKEVARQKAQEYIDNHNMLEGDRSRWGQDKVFLKLLNEYLTLGGKATDLKGKTPTIRGNTRQYYAKGTTGTKKDQWAITDEPQWGDELTLVPGKDGNLSFMRKGTGVVPAKLTERIMELAMQNPSDMSGTIVKPIVSNIKTNTNAINVSFEALVKADNITNDVLPEVEKMVSKQLDKFTRSLNYSLRKVGAN